MHYWRSWSLVGGFLILIVVLSACTSGDGTPIPTSIPTATDVVPDATGRSSVGGRLAILDELGRVVVVNPDGNEPRVLASPDEGEVYFQPTWSPEGSRIAAGYANSGSAGLALIDASTGDVEVVNSEAMPFFSYWSPTGEDIGFLNNGPEAGLDMTVHNTTTGETMVLGRGAPFYFSWAPDGESVATHVGGESMEIRSLDGAIRTLDPPGAFQAPQWTESGLFHLGVAPRGQQLLLTKGETRGLGLISGQVLFTSNKDGSLIAVFSNSDQDGISAVSQTVPLLPGNRLLVLEVASGKWEIVSADPVGGFFWSPAGDHLLLIGRGETAGSLRWSVWDGELTRFESFQPSPGFVLEFLPFFDQYAQSMTLWSPDGGAFAYPAMANGRSGIWIQDVGGGDPVWISDGTWVSWSAQNTPDPAG